MINLIFFQDVITDDCGSTFSCYKSPSTCTSSQDCKILVKFKYENNKIHIVATTNITDGYVGWAQSLKNDKMVMFIFCDVEYFWSVNLNIKDTFDTWIDG